MRRVSSARRMTFFQPSLTDDDSGIFVSSKTFGCYDLVSTRDGTTLSSVSIPNYALAEHEQELICLQRPADHEAFFSSGDTPGRGGPTKLFAWNTSTSTIREIAQTPAWQDPRAPQGFVYDRRFLPVPNTNPQEFVAIPQFMEAHNTKSFIVQWFDGTGKQIASADLGLVVSRFGGVTFTPDGGLLLCSEQSKTKIIAFDAGALRKSVARREQTLGVQDGTQSGALAYSRDGRWLVISARDTISVRDTQRKAWTASLTGGPTYILSGAALSFDASIIAARALRNDSKNTPPSPNRVYTYDILIWKVPPEMREPPAP